ncbi:MAG: M23 family metallopeptidase [Candidatus Aminicenantes bacterium]|nr:M23 family metallopeptidase [Candidatus Aminicenantes bacterium]
MNFKITILGFSLLMLISCGENPFSVDSRFLLGDAVLDYLPTARSSILYMAPFGFNGSFFHNGIDFGCHGKALFYSCADGVVTEVNLNTGEGYPGTNYRIRISVSPRMTVEYHFEIGGNASEQERKDNIFVSKGDRVQGGQPIAYLLNLCGDAHVHFQVEKNGETSECPLNFFSSQLALELEDIYDDPAVQKRPDTRENLCE